MRSLSILVINEHSGSESDPVKIVEEAARFFPTRIWDEIRYIGGIALKHDVRIATSKGSLGAFFFSDLLKKIKEAGSSSKLFNLLLGITHEPILAEYFSYDGGGFKRAIYLIHDYVGKNIGFVSLFRVSEESSCRVIAHGLGHNRGLRHHAEPIDVMYSALLRSQKLEVDGFCRSCVRELQAKCEGD